MSLESNPEPDQPGLIIYVGQDSAGHWLVQDSRRTLEGRFISRGAAMSYAEAERQMYAGKLEVTSRPLTPLIPFSPPRQDECALPRAA
jgi:hypothetical protein